jgi:hypothetical protein
MTNFEMIRAVASLWNCIGWFTPPNILHFHDSTAAFSDTFSTGGLSSNSLIGITLKEALKKPDAFNLGYMTDAPGVPNNVEHIQWKHVNQHGDLAGSVAAFGERAKSSKSPYDDKIYALGATWKMRPDIQEEIKKNPARAAYYAGLAAASTVSFRAYQLLKKLYYIESYDNSDSKEVPAHASSGLELQIDLNEGDPYLKPPMVGYLYHGSDNPRLTAYLPQWLFKHSPDGDSPTIVNINTVEIFYEQGRLKQRLDCSISWYGGGGVRKKMKAIVPTQKRERN